MKEKKLSSLKIRVISAIVALIIVVPLIILGGIYFKAGVCLIAVLAFKEVIDLKVSHDEIPSGMVFLAVLSLVALILANGLDASLYNGFTYQLLALIALVLIAPIIFYKNNKYSSKTAFYLLGIVFFLGLCFNLFNVVRMRGLNRFIFLLIIPIFNDIFAFLLGSLIGKHKMCKSISPNKTWEGSIGGLIVGSIVGLLFYHFLVGSVSFSTVIMVVLLSIAGQGGDLVMSKIKRENGIKDFSNIMPGHGGILDRIDSTIFVFLTYIILITIL